MSEPTLDRKNAVWCDHSQTWVTLAGLKRLSTPNLKRWMHDLGVVCPRDYTKQDMVDALRGRVFGELPE